MNSKTTFSFRLSTLNLRRELRLALLAAMETCWVYAIVVSLAALMRLPAPLIPLPFFIAYWLAMSIGRVLPGTRQRWLILQATAILSTVICVFAVARIELYWDLTWYDMTWLPRFLANLFLSTRGIAIEQLVSAAVIYVFIRGLGFGQRPLTLWFIGFQFRLGIVIFFGLFFFAAFFRGAIDEQFFAVWTFVYFFLSLCAIALARIEEMNADIRYTPRWVMTMLASVSLVLFIGLGVLQVFTVDSTRMVLAIFTPLWALFSLVLILLAIPFGVLLEWLVNFLKPIFELMGQTLENLQNSPLADFVKGVQDLEHAVNNELLANIVKTILILTVVLIVGYLLARALNKKMLRIEEETYIRESISDEDMERASRASTKKKTKPRARPRDIAAETIRRIYAALVARAAEAGLTRRAAETPYEFLPRLEKQWDEESADLRSITEAYVQVHYAEQTMPAEQVRRVREIWRRVEEKIKRKA